MTQSSPIDWPPANDPRPPRSAEPRRLPLLHHLAELRSTLVGCALALLVGFTIAACFFPVISRVLQAPLRWAMSGKDYAGTASALATTSPMAVFSVLMQICLLGGFGLALPVILWLLGRFVAPALRQQERQWLTPACSLILGLFLTGALFSYFVVLPITLSAALQLNAFFGFQQVWNAAGYYGLVVGMTLGTGLCFQFPLVLLILARFGILPIARLKAIRRQMIVGVLIFAAIINPVGDPITMLVLAVPLYLLYEGAIWLGARMETRRLRDQAVTITA